MRVERVAGNEEPDQLLLARQLLRLRPLGEARQRRSGSAVRPVAAEQALLAGLALALLQLGLAQRSLETLGQRGARAEPVQSAGPDECFDDALIVEAQIDAAAKIEQRAERPVLLASRDDRVDGRAADAADRAQPEADARVAHDRELVARLVDVRRQHLEAEGAALVDVADDAIGVADLRRE